MRFVTRFSLLVLLAAAPALAAPRAAVPSLVTAADDGTTALALDSLRIDVLIRGHLARTTFELTYRNDLPRDIDGNFSFPLPAGAEVSDLGLYFHNHLRHAAAVERVQARTAYEETVHRRVDPALAEWSSSTRAFHFRIYPIPAHGTKVVHISYDQELTSTPYELDLRYDTTLAAFDLSIDADTSVEGDGIPLRRAGDTWSASRRELRLDGMLRATRSDTETALVAWSPADRMWYASAPIRVHSAARAIQPATHVTLLYDASASAVQRDDRKLRDFLRPLLAEQGSSVTVSVVPFHISVESARETNATNLERTLDDIPAAGATNFIALLEQLPAIAASSPAGSRIVLVTDGINTLGDSRRLARAVGSATKIRRPLTIVNASPSADDNLLGGLARATGGWYIDLTHADPADAAEAAMRLPTLTTVESGLPPIRDYLPATLLVTTDVVTTISARSRDRIVTFPVIAGGIRHEAPVHDLDSEEGRDLVRSAWARARLRSLLDRGASPEEVLEHGRSFSQLTPQTSLLVLDSWRDYEVYGVPMPAEVRAERDEERARILQEQHGPAGTIKILGATSDPPSSPAVWFIKGTVAIEDGPLPGATLTLSTPDQGTITTVTDANGRFWLALQHSPAAFTIRAELEGLNTVTRSFPKGAPKGSVIEILMRLRSVAEAITVTASAPALEPDTTQIDGPRYASLVKRSDLPLADKLLAALASDSAPPATAELAQASLTQRLELIDQVVAKLKSLSSIDDRFRYYIAARSVLGGDKMFQAEAALAVHDESPELAVRWLSDLVEAYPDDSPTLRIIGRVLEGWGRVELARLLFERALELSPRETQTWRELLLLEAKDGNEPAFADLQRRYAAYSRDQRMHQTDDALSVELQHRRAGTDPRIDESAGLQVEAMWDSNYTDVDLHVIEPGGEEVFYSHPLSRNSGRLHADVTTGFGPEIYTLPRIEEGSYQIILQYYAGDLTRLEEETLVHVIVYVKGRRRDFFVVLTSRNDRRLVATVTR